MGATRNYIGESERNFVNGSIAASIIGTLWTSDGSLEPDAVIYQDSEYGSLELVASATSHYVRYNIWSNPAVDEPSQFAITTTFDNGDYIEGFCWVRTTKNASFRISTVLTKVTLDAPTQTYLLSTNPADVYESEDGVHIIAIGSADAPRWHLLRSPRLNIPQGTAQYSVGMKIEIENGDASAVYNFSRPTLMATFAVLDNRFMQEMAAFIPPVFLEMDTVEFNDNSPSIPLVRILDIATTISDDIYDKYEQIMYLDESEGKNLFDALTLSTLITPDIAETATLFWLAQFRGRDLFVTYEPSTEGEPWTLFILDESALNGIGVLGSGETFGAIPGGVEEFYRWQVETGAYGHNAGTIPSMVSAIQLLLTGNKFINYTVGANTINFQTYYTETYNATVDDVGDASPFVLEVLEPTRPMGMILTHEIIAP